MTQNVFSCHGNVAVAQINVDGVRLLKYLANPEKYKKNWRYASTLQRAQQYSVS